MARLKLVANPTFDAKVMIGIPGGDSVGVMMTFKNRTRTELVLFYNELTPKDAKPDEQDKEPDPKEGIDRDTDLFMKMVTAWELEDAFTRENVRLLIDNYFNVAASTFETYSKSIQGAKLGN